MTTFDERSYYTSGRCLFRTVIRRAQLEAEGMHLVCVTPHETQEQLRKEAREWITTDSEDLREIWELCEFDGVTLEQFLEKSRGKHGTTGSSGVLSERGEN